ncbi:MAG: NAD(P)-dependent oxidoreductase [Acidobacteriota bacterium]
MHVVLYGASGMIGSRILAELVRRGHTVSAATRHPEMIASAPGVTPVLSDATKPESVAQTAKGCEAAINAISPAEGEPMRLVQAAKSLLQALPEAGIQRLIVVGNAGTLEVSPGVKQMDLATFPSQWMGVAVAQRDVLHLLQESQLDWTFYCPASILRPGQRTEKFRVDTGKMIFEEERPSHISVEDFAVAIVDELENPQHIHEQCTAAY